MERGRNKDRREGRDKKGGASGGVKLPEVKAVGAASGSLVNTLLGRGRRLGGAGVYSAVWSGRYLIAPRRGQRRMPPGAATPPSGGSRQTTPGEADTEEPVLGGFNEDVGISPYFSTPPPPLSSCRKPQMV